MMMRRAAAAALVCVTVGCADAVPARQIVVLLDGTASIPVDTRRDMARAVGEMAGQLRRGERLTVIPITGRAGVDTPGRILRFQAELRREPYDADRRRLAATVKEAIGKLSDEVEASPYRDTDLIGAFQFAGEELSDAADVDKRIVCLSDLIQDDRQFNFKTGGVVRDDMTAKAAAGRLAAALGTHLKGTAIYVGMVQSSDSLALRESRQVAIRAFWTEWLERQGGHVYWKSDGLGHWKGFLQQPALARELKVSAGLSTPTSR